MLKRNLYRKELLELKKLMSKAKLTPFNNYAKVVTLVLMNMRYENVAFNLELKEHPFLLTQRIINDAKKQFQSFLDISFIESDNKSIEKVKSEELIEKHKELWQEIWPRHQEEEFKKFIALKAMRININNLVDLIYGKDCVDFGCGNGAFVFALIEKGAKSVTGIDFGEISIQYATNIAKRWKLEKKAKFMVGDVTKTNLKNDSYDFAISNGVFHHLARENVIKALHEVVRVLKKNGWFWYYVDGKDAISMDLWDISVEILKEVDILFIERVLKNMNVKRNKMIHIMDGLSATYLHSSFDEVINQLSKCGFSNFQRLRGGTDTDLDYDRIKSDKYGKEKFGDGDIRIVCQLVKK